MNSYVLLHLNFITSYVSSSVVTDREASAMVTLRRAGCACVNSWFRRSTIVLRVCMRSICFEYSVSSDESVLHNITYFPSFTCWKYFIFCWRARSSDKFWNIQNIIWCKCEQKIISRKIIKGDNFEQLLITASNYIRFLSFSELHLNEYYFYITRTEPVAECWQNQGIFWSSLFQNIRNLKVNIIKIWLQSNYIC